MPRAASAAAVVDFPAPESPAMSRAESPIRTQLACNALGDDGLSVHSGSPVGHKIVDQRCGRDHVIGRDHADRNDMVRRRDNSVGRHRNDRIEITPG